MKVWATIVAIAAAIAAVFGALLGNRIGKSTGRQEGAQQASQQQQLEQAAAAVKAVKDRAHADQNVSDATDSELDRRLSKHSRPD